MDPHNPIIEKPMPMKFCNDCKNFRPLVTRILFWNVKGPESLAKCAAFPDMVSGAPGRFCDLLREYGPCGKEGKLWEPK